MLVIATPLGGADSLCATVTQGYSEHVRALSHELGAVQLVSYSGSHVHARNRITAILLRDYLTEPDDVALWWDADQWPEQRALAAQMLAAVAAGSDLIAAPYTTKEKLPKFTHKSLRHSRAENGCIEAAGVGFGFTMTTRRCLAAVTAAAKVYYEDGQPVANCFGHMYAPIIADEPDGREALMGEDFSFCQRWRDLGGQVHVYLNAGIMHHAGVKSYTARDIPGAVVESPAMAEAAE